MTRGNKGEEDLIEQKSEEAGREYLAWKLVSPCMSSWLSELPDAVQGCYGSAAAPDVRRF